MTVTTEPSSRSLTANGLSLHYLEWGRPGALPVVCVHGYTSSAQAFNALARHLQDRFHFLALDVRGLGRAPGRRPEPTPTPIRPTTWRRSPTGSASTSSC